MGQKTQFIADLRIKDDIQSVFLVKYIALMEARDGKTYLNIIFSDKTGDIEARLWQKAEEVYEQFQKGDFVFVQGKVNGYQGRKQLIISNLEKQSLDEVNYDDYVTKSDQDAEVMFNELLSIVHGLKDVYIRDLLQQVLQHEEIAYRLKVWPAGKTIHHAYQSGLLEHILSCSKLAVMISEHYKANVNFIVAGCILHDLCKIYELTSGLNVEYTEEGKLVGHLTMGIELVEAFCKKIKNFPEETKLHLKHILLSHHGEYAYGSPKVPQTTEAFLVHLIDLLDSKVGSIEIVKRTDTQAGPWSGYVKHLDRILYKDPLPFYPEYVGETPKKKTSEVSRPQGHKSSHQNKELKQNLGKLFEGIKIE